MRNLLRILCIVALCSHAAASQTDKDRLRQQSENNLPQLTSSPAVLQRVQIDDKGVAILPRGDSKPEFQIYWDEVPNFVDIIESRDFYTLQQVYLNKKSNRFAWSMLDIVPRRYNGFPTQFENLRVALDPGHFGGDLEEARLEGRVVNIKGEDLGRAEDVHFFEADLTFHTALLLKRRLEEQGATVMLTRPKGAGALSRSFSGWLKSSFRDDLARAWKLGDLQKGFYDTLTKAFTDTAKAAHRYYLFQFYKYLDFRARSKKINEFHPDVTFVIHYNASEQSRPYGKERYIKPVKSNYAMAFVPGSFEYDEFDKPDRKMDFIRLLLSPDLGNSVRLAEILVDKHRDVLGVPPIPFDSLLRMKDVVIPTAHPGVFCRNLYLTRSVRGIVVYGESLYQDNFQEAIELSKKDYSFMDPETFLTYKTASRCAQVADAYYESLRLFLAQNKELLDAGTMDESGQSKQ